MDTAPPEATPIPPPPPPAEAAAGPSVAPSSAAPAADGTEDNISSGGYHYWHGNVPAGAPAPTPQMLASETVESALPEVTIENYGFMDDDDVVKVYIALEGDLQGVTADGVTLDVTSKFDVGKLNLAVRGTKSMHTLKAEKLFHDVDPEGCKFKVLSKKGKLVLTLKKKNPHDPWEGLRTKLALPYRRGGGGAPR